MNQLTRAVPLVALVGFLVLIGLGGCPSTSEGLSDQESVATDKAALVIGYAGTDSATSVTQALTLPTTGASGTTITWASDMTDVIANNGAVTRPAADAADATVKLTATITKNEASGTKEFSLTVKKALSDAESVAADKAALVIGYAQGDSAASVTQDMTLPATGASGTTISWTSSDTNVIANNGTVTRPAADAANDATVTLTATITKNSESVTKEFTLTVPKMSQAVDSAPGKPTNVQAVAGNARVTITWAAPMDKGTVSGAAGTITGYKIYYSKNNPVTTSDTSVEVSDTMTLSQVVESLTNGTAYYFAVTASNGSGEGDLSDPASATPVAGKQDLASMQLSYPAITMDFGATSGNTASPNWTVPADDVDYSITSRPTGATPDNVTIDTNTGEVTATTNAASADSGDYTIEATAKTGSTSYTGTKTATLTLTITKQTGKPTSVSATPGNEKVTLGWTAPDVGYSGSMVGMIQGYNIYYSETQGFVATGTLIDKSSDSSTSVEITGLTNGTTYYFRVQAVTDQGDGELSDEASGTPQSGKIDLSTVKPGYPETHTHTYVFASTPKTEITPTWVVPDSEVTYSFSARPQLSENAHVHIDPDTGIVTIEAGAQQQDIGTYTVEAVAKDTSTGYTGTATQDFTLTVNAKPESPSITSATPTDAGGIDLAWAIPTETGYSGTTPEALTKLEITINPAPTSGATRSVSVSETTETIADLDPGTTYTFTMTASNTHGKSTASSEKSATTKSDLSTATLSYEGALTRDFNATAVDSGSPSWAGGPGTPTNLTYSIAAATTGTPTEDGTTLSGNGISINTDGVITVGTAVEVKHSGDYVVTATAAEGDGNYIVGTTATLTVPVAVKAIAIASLNSAEFSLTVTDTTTVTALTGGTHTATVGGSLSAGTDYDLSITGTGVSSGAVRIANDGTITIADSIVVNDAGTYTVKATGKGNYNGEKAVTFTLSVDPKDIAKVQGFSISIGDQTVTGSQATTFSVAITNNAGLTAGTDYGLSIEKDGAAVNAVTINNDGLVSIKNTIDTGDTGTYTVKAAGETNSNYTGEETVDFVLTVVYKIGDPGPAGGIVFYDKGSESDGWRYLEAATSDQATSVEWGGHGTSVGGTSTGIGDGKANTEAIVRALGDGNYAAKICDDLDLGGYADWFLPSKDELAELYKQKNTVGGFASNYFWSSSESSSSNAWFRSFNDGYQTGSSKDNDYHVRAVRAF